MKTESTTLVRQRETTEIEGICRPCRLELQEKTWKIIFFHVFSCSSNLRFLMRSVLTTVCSGSNCCPYIVMSSSQLSLSCLLSCIHCLLAFSFKFLSANQNSLIRCWYISIFNAGVPNYFTCLQKIITISYLKSWNKKDWLWNLIIQHLEMLEVAPNQLNKRVHASLYKQDQK